MNEYIFLQCIDLDNFLQRVQPEVSFASPVSGTDSAGMGGCEDWEGLLASLGHFREERLGAGQGEGLTGQGGGWKEANRGLTQEQVLQS